MLLFPKRVKVNYFSIELLVSTSEEIRRIYFKELHKRLDGGTVTMIRIIVGGDVCPMGNIQSAFMNGSALEIFNDLFAEISNADLAIVNLECPLVSKETPIEKAGMVLGASVECIKGLVASNWNVINLANNHSYDHGAIGLSETIETIRKAGLDVLGAGQNIHEAQLPNIKQINGQRIVLYAMAEREFSVADENCPGANPLDLISLVRAIHLYKQSGIFIVLIHGGKEFYPFPSPEMMRRCRFMIDMGADAVVCTHAHCPQPWEIYNNRPIIYGLGNLVFEPLGRLPEEEWYYGYLAKLVVDGGQVRFEAVPYWQSKEIGARSMSEDARNGFLERILIANERIKDKTFLEAQWTNYCSQRKADYLARLSGHNRLLALLKKCLLSTHQSRIAMIEALHLVQCETHQEILNTIFREERRKTELPMADLEQRQEST